MDGRPLVSGASGQLGRLTAELLVAAGAEPILVTRTPEAVAGLGGETRFGDYGEPDSLRDAYEGAERLLLISAPDLQKRTEQHRAAIAAASAVGVRHVIYTSGLNPEPPNPAIISPSHHATEQALATSGLAWTVLRDSLYSEYQVPEVRQAIAAGTLTHNRGDGQIAYVSREDCAAVAASVLTGSGHEGRVYDVTGPELFTARELATLYGALGGCDVRDEALDDDAFTELLAGAFGGGDDEHARYGAKLVASFGRSIREGYMASRSDVVEQLTGRPPRALRSVLEAGL
ncbi:MAG TPA: NAD(P)H-binding protein [Solirubrobacteraceae bacterium]|nr:NAD(P)H-binding protein [Solirubrobacteraceae bacterium]